MADTTVTIRVDEDIKRRFEEFCADVGMNMSVAVNMFIRASLRELKLPFPIESSGAFLFLNDVYRKLEEGEYSIHAGDVMDGFHSLRTIKEKHGL